MRNLLKGSKWNELSWHEDRCLCWGAGWLVLAVHQASRLLWPVKAHLTAKMLRIMIQEKAPGIKLQNGGKRTVLLAKQFYTAWALLCIQHPTSSLLFTPVFLPAHFSLFSQYAECAQTRREWHLHADNPKRCAKSSFTVQSNIFSRGSDVARGQNCSHNI